MIKFYCKLAFAVDPTLDLCYNRRLIRTGFSLALGRA